MRDREERSMREQIDELQRNIRSDIAKQVDDLNRNIGEIISKVQSEVASVRLQQAQFVDGAAHVQQALDAKRDIPRDPTQDKQAPETPNKADVQKISHSYLPEASFCRLPSSELRSRWSVE